jgi:hypothetical protein
MKFERLFTRHESHLPKKSFTSERFWCNVAAFTHKADPQTIQFFPSEDICAMTDSTKPQKTRGTTKRKTIKDRKTRWTVMCYLAGDNNLSTDMAYTVEQIQSVAKDNPNVDLYVYFDGYSRNVPTLYCDFSDHSGPVKYFKSSGIANKLIKRARKNKNVFNENSASMNNIINFVNWCVEKDKDVQVGSRKVDRRKSKKYALVISGHSFGFSNWALFKDENADFHMTLARLRWLFERISLTGPELRKLELSNNRNRKKGTRGISADRFRERTKEILGKPLDLLGFDSCEMSKIEIGSEFAGLAKTLVASEGSVPNAGWNYAQILLGRLKGAESTDELKVAAGFVESFVKQQNKFAIADLSVDMTAWDLSKLRPLESAIGELATNLLAALDKRNRFVFHQMKRVLTHVHWRSQTYSFEQNVDLGDLCDQLSSELELLKSEIDPSVFGRFQKVLNSCNKVRSALKNVVLLCGFSGSDFQYSKGISIFFPWSWDCYESTKEDYRKLHFIRREDTGEKWDDFLRCYLGNATWRPSNRLTPADEDGNFMIDPSNPSVVYVSYRFVNPKSAELLADGWLDGEKRPPDGPKRPPDGPKRPPDGPRRPPDGPKRPPDGPKGLNNAISSGNMSTFLSRFLKMKNVGTYWNRTGFVSSRVDFNSEEASDRGRRGTRASGKLMTVDVPVPTGIQKLLGLMASNLAANHSSAHLIGSSAPSQDEEVLNAFQNLLIDTSHRAGESDIVAEALLSPKFAGRFAQGKRRIPNLEAFLTKAVDRIGIEHLSSAWREELRSVDSKRRNGRP